MNTKFTLSPWFIALLVAVIGLACAGGLYWLVWIGPNNQTQTVFIPRKTHSAKIAKLLADAGIIRNQYAFRAYSSLSKAGRQLQAGEYAFPAHTSMAEVVRIMRQGKVVRHTLVVPEGFTAAQIAERLDAIGLVTGEAFMNAVHNPALCRAWDLPGDSLEGFLFPDTYELIRDMNPEDVAKMMVDRFRDKVKIDFAAAAKQQGVSFYQLIIMASIIEREVRVPREKPLVASIFYNRLRQKKRLESCATVLYSQGRTHGSLSLADLQTHSPYNTYRHAGLPPGPISNPGLESIRAAAEPAQTDYLFFVVRPDGQHEFSKDFETHKKAKWRQKRVRQELSQEKP